jgi:hypothetical protein
MVRTGERTSWPAVLHGDPQTADHSNASTAAAAAPPPLHSRTGPPRAPAGSPPPPVLHLELTTAAPGQLRGGGRVVIVGDVHGCSDELTALLAKLGFIAGLDNLLLVGDLVGKGPEPMQARGTCGATPHPADFRGAAAHARRPQPQHGACAPRASKQSGELRGPLSPAAARPLVLNVHTCRSSAPRGSSAPGRRGATTTTLRWPRTGR